MKPIITVLENNLSGKDVLKTQLNNLGKSFEAKGFVEYIPRPKKATQVIRVLRENGIEYEIRFENS